jgi:hypothetical protein
MSTLAHVPDLRDPQHALDVGFAEGSPLREKGGKPELLNNMRDTYYETPHRHERSLSPYYPMWRRGFDAGYLGQPKPSLL